MKIIHIVGGHNSGKTTFIHKLLPALSGLGTTAVIKHLHSHLYSLEKGKDTTTHYEHGADVVSGIDPEKAVVAIRSGDLNGQLRMLCDMGVEYVIIEGHKTYPYPKIVIGDLEIENTVLSNPSVDDVIASMDSFSDYYSMQGCIHALRRSVPMPEAGCIVSFNGIVRECTDGTRTEYLDFPNEPSLHELCADVQNRMAATPGILGAVVRHQTGRLHPGEDITYIAVIAQHREEAFSALSAGINRIKTKLHEKGMTIDG